MADSISWLERSAVRRESGRLHDRLLDRLAHELVALAELGADHLRDGAVGEQTRDDLVDEGRVELLLLDELVQRDAEDGLVVGRELALLHEGVEGRPGRVDEPAELPDLGEGVVVLADPGESPGELLLVEAHPAVARGALARKLQAVLERAEGPERVDRVDEREHRGDVRLAVGPEGAELVGQVDDDHEVHLQVVPLAELALDQVDVHAPGHEVEGHLVRVDRVDHEVRDVASGAQGVGGLRAVHDLGRLTAALGRTLLVVGDALDLEVVEHRLQRLLVALADLGAVNVAVEHRLPVRPRHGDFVAALEDEGHAVALEEVVERDVGARDLEAQPRRDVQRELELARDPRVEARALVAHRLEGVEHEEQVGAHEAPLTVVRPPLGNLERELHIAAKVFRHRLEEILQSVSLFNHRHGVPHSENRILSGLDVAHPCPSRAASVIPIIF